MRGATIAVLVLALAGCAAAAQTSGPAPADRSGEARNYRQALDAQFTAPGVAAARLGGTARLGDVAVRPILVLEDSRCPRDVQCVWAGRLRLKAAITGVPGDAELILGEPFQLPPPSSGSGGSGGTIILTAAAPEPWHNPPPGIETGAATRFAFRRDR